MCTVYFMLYTIYYCYFHSAKLPLFYLLFSCRGPSSMKTPDVAELEEEVHNCPLKCNLSLKVNIHAPHPVPKEHVSEQKIRPNIPNRVGVSSFVDIRCFVTKTCLSVLRTQKLILHKGICIRHKTSLFPGTGHPQRSRGSFGVLVFSCM